MPQLKSSAVVAGTLCLLAWLPGCVAGVDADVASVEPHVPTYHQDIAPLVARSCLPCHAEGSPHAALEGRDDFEQHAERALELVRAGAMPKSNIDRSGACQELVGPAPLTEDDVDRLAAYVEHGMPAGEAPATPSPAEPPSMQLDVTVTVASEPYLPARDAGGGTGDHRCFLITDAAPGAGELRAFRVLPGRPELVHHAMLFALDTELDAHAARTLDAQSAGPGWACFGTPGVADARLVGVWTPGRDVVRFPEGYATRLGRGGLVVQLHYDGPAPAAPDQTRFALELGDGSARELRFQPFSANALVLPPAREAIETRRSGALVLPEGSQLLGVYPHMHALGRSLSLTARLGGGPTETCLVDAPRWDYAFQELALYRMPLRVGRDDPELTITCQHSTLHVDHEVRWGERLEDEMCMAFVLTSED